MHRWAKVAWRTLHGVAILYPGFDINRLLGPMQFLMPCPLCRAHLQEYLLLHAGAPDCTFHYLWLLHHEIGQSAHTYQEICTVYARALVADPVHFIECVHDAAWELGWIFLAFLDTMVVGRPAAVPQLQAYMAAVGLVTGSTMSWQRTAHVHFLPSCLTATLFDTQSATVRWWWRRQHASGDQTVAFVEDLLGPLMIPLLADEYLVADATWVRARLAQRERAFRGPVVGVVVPPRTFPVAGTVLLVLLGLLLLGLLLRRRYNKKKCRPPNK
jgi:hypothetical protein